MKTVTIIITVCLLFFGGCKGKPAPVTDRTPGNRQAVETKDPADERVILEIGAGKFYNHDLKRYVGIQYGYIDDVEKNSRLLSRIFDFFIDHKILVTAADMQKTGVTELEYDDYLKNLKISGKEMDKLSVMEFLKVQKFLSQTVYREITVAPKDIRQYYDSHRQEMIKKREVQLYQILFKDKEKALSVSSQLKNDPLQFDALARSASASPEDQKGGLLGFFEEGTLPKEMEDVVFSLKLNEISPVVESPYGFHIFKVTKQSKGGLLPLSEALEVQIENKLLAERLSVARQQYLENLKKDLPIVITYENLYFEYNNK